MKFVRQKKKYNLNNLSEIENMSNYLPDEAKDLIEISEKIKSKKEEDNEKGYEKFIENFWILKFLSCLEKI